MFIIISFFTYRKLKYIYIVVYLFLSFSFFGVCVCVCVCGGVYTFIDTLYIYLFPRVQWYNHCCILQLFSKCVTVYVNPLSFFYFFKC